MSNLQQQTKSLHIAPMLHVSNIEFRAFMRILSKRAVLWTEMVVDETLYFANDNDYDVHLGYDPNEQALVCQIGGIDPEYTAFAVRVIQEYGYTEINLNIDCPSNRVQGKEFGAVLMKKADKAVALLSRMKEESNVAISVKCRIGIDDMDDIDFLVGCLQRLSVHCQKFVIHARKCLLEGLSPAQNRIVPSLNYPTVYRLCGRLPNCEFWINGGIPGLKEAKTIAYGLSALGIEDPLDDAAQHSVPCSVCNLSNGSCIAPPVQAPPNLRGCMLGRAAVENPSLFWDVDRYWYGCSENPCQTRRQVLEEYCHFLERTYPRRCCDNDERVTTRIPAPDVVHTQPYCYICYEIYKGQCTKDNDDYIIEILQNGESQRYKNSGQQQVKISSRIMDRCFKPVLGIFFQLPKSKAFRRTCTQLSRDLVIRNCGPATLLRKAMWSVVPDDVLDRPFVPTEQLKDSDVIRHVEPTNCHARS